MARPQSFRSRERPASAGSKGSSRAPQRPISTEMPALTRVRDERGFTLIEVLVTMMILVVGIGGALALIDGANARTVATKEREAGNALTREVIESARSVPYRQLNPNNAVATLKAVPGLADTTPLTTAWTVERRNQTYTISLSVCSVDDDQDGFGDTSGGNFCTGSPGGADRNPDDYKRITAEVSWTRGSTTRSVKQAGIVSNDASSAGPSVEFTSPAAGIDEITSTLSPVKFSVQAQDDAVSIRFAVDGVLLDTANSTSATFGWDIDDGNNHVPDGTYLISVTAFDAEGVPGPTRTRTMRLNRDAPAAPADVFGGWNPRADFTTSHDIVEIQWARNTEPDVIGYRVYRKAGDVLVPGCDFTSNPATDPMQTDCRDVNPPAGATIDYYVVALDRDTAGAARQGGHSATITATRATTKPNQPPTLTAQADDDTVVLIWDASPAPTPGYSGSNIIFYRVYRDGTAISNRIARTSLDSMTSYRDSGVAADGHQYYVTAVDDNFSESAPLGPVAVP
jgi:prepilin-type N-terminal cleavage/methylation domain-containing protein